MLWYRFRFRVISVEIKAQCRIHIEMTVKLSWLFADGLLPHSSHTDTDLIISNQFIGKFCQAKQVIPS